MSVHLTGMQKYLVILALLVVPSCAGVQRVTECTAKQTNPLLEPLANLIWDDVRGKRYEPSKFVSDSVADFAVEAGVAAVRCTLRELISQWSRSRDAMFAAEREIAIKIAQDLHDEL